MNFASKLFLFLLFGLLLVQISMADSYWQCDCEEIQGGCRGTVSQAGNWLDIRSSSRECSRIDYQVNGQPFVATITDGRGQREWMGPSRIESISVQGCVVCLDKRARVDAQREARCSALLSEANTLLRGGNYEAAQARFTQFSTECGP